MKKYYFVIIFIGSSFIFFSCKKSKIIEDQLPPITQVGANTFGCLINGKLYTPKGFEQNKPNFDMIVDPNNNGNVDIRTFRKDGLKTSSLSFSCFNIFSSDIFILPFSDIFPNYIDDINSNVCYFVSSQNNFRKGSLKITRYDLTNKIISGTFEFTLFDSTISCDTIHITQGRFDKKF
ncbi:hypothetical protein ACFOWM_12385 [Ferruginibacter yonginensis]|uniref:Lipoprotein n=1 Tax=Ferruginibacter yonginensis TaxID=1310416 RepID=A0ABV8QXH9_9BACT